MDSGFVHAFRDARVEAPAETSCTKRDSLHSLRDTAQDRPSCMHFAVPGQIATAGTSCTKRDLLHATHDVAWDRPSCMHFAVPGVEPAAESSCTKGDLLRATRGTARDRPSCMLLCHLQADAADSSHFSNCRHAIWRKLLAIRTITSAGIAQRFDHPPSAAPCMMQLPNTRFVLFAVT